MSERTMIKESGTHRHHAWLILVGCCFLQAGGLGAVLNSAGVFFVPVCEDLGFTRGSLSTYITIYMITTSLSMPFAGRLLSGRANLRVIMSICALLVAGAVAAMGFYTEVWQWQLSGAVLGAAGAFIFILPTASMVGNWFTTFRGRAMGIATSFAGIGAAGFAPLFNHFIETYGWRDAYLMVGAIIVVMILPWTLFVFRLKPEDMGLAPYGHSVQSDEGAPVVRTGISAGLAIKSAPFVALFLFAGLIALEHGIDIHIAGFAQSIGFASAFAALMVSAEATGSIMDKLIMGGLNDIIGVQRTTFLQFAIVALGLLGFIYSRSPIVLLLSAAAFGVQDSLMSVSVPLLIRQLFGDKDYTRIHAYIRVGVGVFGGFGPIIVGSFYDRTGSFSPAFLGGILLCVLGAGLIALAYRTRVRMAWDRC